MPITLPNPAITPIPNTEPDAVPELWNTRYSEINANFAAIKTAIDTAESHNHTGAYAPVSHRHDASEIDNLPSGGGGWTAVDATTTVKGIARLATGPECLAGAVVDAIVTPNRMLATIDQQVAAAAGDYAAAGHTHGGTYAAASHTHVAGDITNLGGTLRTDGASNTAGGDFAMLVLSGGSGNTAYGRDAMNSMVSGTLNVAIGAQALFTAASEFCNRNVAIGNGALMNSYIATNDNVAIGFAAINEQTGGSSAVAIGSYAMQQTKASFTSVAAGYESMQLHPHGYSHVAIGCRAMKGVNPNATRVDTDICNVAVGFSAMQSLERAQLSVGVGGFALLYGGMNCTAVGYGAMDSVTQYTNSSALGCDADVSGNNQVQLGDASTTTYVYGTVQNRSDIRDKADIRDTQLGLSFITALRPVDYKWDMREDYLPSRPYPVGPDASAEEKAAYEAALAARASASIDTVTRDGSKKRSRYHHGLIAQEVKATLDQLGIDFGGYQDHRINGGRDVLSIGYDELVAPLIKAVQELAAKNDALEARLAAIEARLA